MHDWHRKHFSTHQFYADVRFDFAQTFPDEKMDLREPGRDRQGYDRVLIRSGPGQPATRSVRLKSTENHDALLAGIRGPMLGAEHREILQIGVNDHGHGEYCFLADFGRIAPLGLALAGKQLSAKAAARQREVPPCSRWAA